MKSRTRHKATAALLRLGALMVCGLLWELVARELGEPLLFPTVGAVLRSAWDDHSLLLNAIGATSATAAVGLGLGGAIALVIGLVGALFPGLLQYLVRQATVGYCIPLVTIAPVLYVVLSGNGPEVVCAAIGAFFPILLGVAQGLENDPAACRSVLASLGCGRLRYTFSVRTWSAVPQLLAAVRIGAAAAVLGATLAEYFGSPNGLGAAMINAIDQLDAPEAYALGITATLLVAFTYVLFGEVARLAFPWASESR